MANKINIMIFLTLISKNQILPLHSHLHQPTWSSLQPLHPSLIHFHNHVQQSFKSKKHTLKNYYHRVFVVERKYMFNKYTILITSTHLQLSVHFCLCQRFEMPQKILVCLLLHVVLLFLPSSIWIHQTQLLHSHPSPNANIILIFYKDINYQ